MTLDRKEIGREHIKAARKKINDQRNIIQKMSASLALNIIGGIIVLLVIFALISSIYGFVAFTRAFKKEYSTTTYHMADTATILVNGDNLDSYVQGKRKEEYIATKARLDRFCMYIHVSLLYVIQVDQSDYGRFVSVFNSVENRVDNSEYTPWELGFKRDTTNDEYRRKYKLLYEKKAKYETIYREKTNDGSHPHITTMVPIMNSDGQVKGILCIQRPISELRSATYPYIRNIGITTLLLALFSAWILSFFIRRQFVKPIEKISDEAARFAKENVKGESLSGISRYNEIADLADSIDTMETDMVNYIEHITVATAERERISTELTFARAIQQNSIPNTFPAFPDRNDFDIYASMTPAKEVGGDFYNFYLIDHDHLAVFIGDVSGKGVPAALFMMVTNILISDRLFMYKDPADILKVVNHNICDHNKLDMFVTLWLGILEIPTGKMTCVNAGHEDAVVYRKGGSFEVFKTKHNFVVGAYDATKYQSFELQLEEGDKLFIYTDGVPEATDKDNQMFSMERMVDALNECKEGSPEDILNHIHKSVNEFVGDEPQFDDLTMLGLELKSK